MGNRDPHDGLTLRLLNSHDRDEVGMQPVTIVKCEYIHPQRRSIQRPGLFH